MIFKIQPQNFNPRFEVVSCYVECDNNPRTQRAEQSSHDGNPRTQRAEQSSHDGNPRTQRAEQSSHDGKILLLHRHEYKSQGNKWGVPAGKIDAGEDEVSAMVRELREETGIELKPAQLLYLDKVFVRYHDYDFVYHMFRAKLGGYPKVVTAEKEHKDFCWVTPIEAFRMNLVDDLGECIKMSYTI